MEDFSIGRLNAPFGVKGYIRVSSYSGETGHFGKLKTILLVREGKTRSAVVESVQEAAGGLVMKLQGVNGPEEARAFMGYEIKVSRNEAAPLGKNQYYVGELAGCGLVLNGVKVADLRSVIDGPACSYLESVLPDGEVRLVPFMNEYVGDVDLAARTVELKVAWILE